MTTPNKDYLRSEIEDIENVDDEEGNEDTSISADLFTISSYGVDNPVVHLISRLEKEIYYIPTFQRAYVWSANDASKFIESLLLGLPVPGIFLYKESDSPRHLVIDGQQRLKSLLAFKEGLLRDRAFKLSGLKSKWDGLTFKELDEDDRIRFEDAIIHTTIFKQDAPSDNMDSVYEVFERINTGGMKLSPQEIRSCVAQGTFNDLLFRLNTNTKWREMFGKKSIRLKDIELILRFFAFLNNRDVYERPVKKFLTDFMTTNKNLSDVQRTKFEDLWNRTIDIIVDSYGAKPFRPGGRALNAAFYDSFTVAVAEELSKGNSVSKEQISKAYDALLVDEEFVKHISSGTSGLDSVKYRFNRAAEIVSGANAL